MMIAVSASDEQMRTAELVAIQRMVNHMPIFATYDADRIRTIAQTVFDLFEVEDGLEREDADPRENQTGQDGHADFEHRLAVRLLGDRLATILEPEHRVRDGGKDDDTDDAGDRKDGLLQVVDLLGVRALRLPGVLGCVFRTTCKKRYRRQTGCTGDETTH